MACAFPTKRALHRRSARSHYDYGVYGLVCYSRPGAKFGSTDTGYLGTVAQLQEAMRMNPEWPCDIDLVECITAHRLRGNDAGAATLMHSDEVKIDEDGHWKLHCLNLQQPDWMLRTHIWDANYMFSGYKILDESGREQVLFEKSEYLHQLYGCTDSGYHYILNDYTDCTVFIEDFPAFRPLLFRAE
jgi:hypothetical protein